jgi:hypothetical protein
LALDVRRRLDERHQRALSRYYIAAGAGGLAVGVHTTQFEIRQPQFGLFRPVLELAREEMDRADAARAGPLVPGGLRTGAEISVAFRSAKVRDFRGAKGDDTTVIDSPVLRDATGSKYFFLSMDWDAGTDYDRPSWLPHKLLYLACEYR